MIRINLLPTTETRRKTEDGQAFLLIFAALVLAEIIALFVWYQSVDEEVARATAAASRAEKKAQDLEKAKQQLEEREKAKLELSRQNVIFEQLKAAKTGPPEMLQFLSYVLTQKEDNLFNSDEIKAQEKAGWAPSWTPANVWITDLDWEPPEVEIKGRAKSHEDVAEFYRRLESGPYFVVPDPVMQEVVTDEVFKNLELVSFQVVAIVNFNQDGVFKMVRAELPERLQRYESVPDKPAAPDKGGGGAEAGKKKEKG